MEQQCCELRRRLAEARRQPMPRGYPQDLRDEVVVLARQPRGQGERREGITRRLGIPGTTVAKWTRAATPEPPRPAPRTGNLVHVEVRPTSAEARAASSAVRLVSPNGFWVEDLSPADAVAALAWLG